MVFSKALTYCFVLSLTDKPGPPGGPIEFKTVTAEKITFLWRPPADDGGAKITHYIVEKRETSRVVWSMVSENLEECIIKTTKIIKGNEYIFRVRAVNKYGIGDSLESDPVVAKNAFGETLFHYKIESKHLHILKINVNSSNLLICFLRMTFTFFCMVSPLIIFFTRWKV